MSTIRRDPEYPKWIKALRDAKAVVRIEARVERGVFGDVKPVGDGVSELRIDYGPGYRVYFITDGDEIVLLLCGGDKTTQHKDIKHAKNLAKKYK